MLCALFCDRLFACRTLSHWRPTSASRSLLSCRCKVVDNFIHSLGTFLLVILVDLFVQSLALCDDTSFLGHLLNLIDVTNCYSYLWFETIDLQFRVIVSGPPPLHHCARVWPCFSFVFFFVCLCVSIAAAQFQNYLKPLGRVHRALCRAFASSTQSCGRGWGRFTPPFSIFLAFFSICICPFSSRMMQI